MSESGPQPSLLCTVRVRIAQPSIGTGCLGLAVLFPRLGMAWHGTVASATTAATAAAAINHHTELLVELQAKAAQPEYGRLLDDIRQLYCSTRLQVRGQGWAAAAV